MLVRHLSAYASSLQHLNYTVDVLYLPKETRLSLLQLSEYANDHGLPVQSSKIAFTPAKLVGTRIYTQSQYDLFVSLADESVPPYIGAGLVSLHSCVACLHQASTSSSKTVTLSSYDVVLTPSIESYEQYLVHTEDEMVANVRSGALIPQIFPLVPPYNMSSLLKSGSGTSLPGHFAPPDDVDSYGARGHEAFQQFTSALGRILTHAKSARPLRQAVHRAGSSVRPVRVNPQSSQMAVCIELRYHYALRSSVINVMSHLPSWSLTVFHGLSNGRFVDEVLIDMPEIELKQLPFKTLTAANYSALVTSFGFWSRVRAETVLLFHPGTVLTGDLEPSLLVPGVVADVVRPRERLELGLPSSDAGVHPVALVDVKKARSRQAPSKTAWHALCAVTADGDCYRNAESETAVAITATANVENDTRLKKMVGAAFNVSINVFDLDSPPRTDDALAWSTYTPSAGAPKTAALYTPYNIIYGGGESYLLQSAASLQSFGYDVDIIVDPGNVAKTVDDVIRTATGLRVDIKRQGLRLLHVAHSGDTLEMQPHNYSVFYLMGNEKVPFLRGIGLLNIYVCQFPFDLDLPPDSTRTKTLTTYDYVFVYSHYVYNYYSKYVSPLFASMVDADMLIPQVELLPPAVQPFQIPRKHATRRRNIALLGRIFLARQGKGQHVAIAAFKALQGRIPANTRLLLIGNVVPGHEAYLQQLSRKAAGLNIDIITGQSQERVLELLQSSLVQWHMTGSDLVARDPASYEHFGMAMVEGMSLGCLPVVLKHGGAADIVQDGVNGYLAADVDEIVEKTAAAFALSPAERQKMTDAGRLQADVFSPAEFTRKFEVIVRRGLLTRPFRHAIRHGAPVMRAHTPLAVSRSTTNLAVIIEPRQHYALRFCTLNVMAHLPRAQWGLHVFHGNTNEKFTRSVLADVDNVRYTRLPIGVMTIPMYNDLLKSRAFWESMQAENVLLFQTDSLLLGTDVGLYAGHYDYVGAPWHQENEKWAPMRDVLGHEGVGNGGLSLRTTASALEIITKHGAASNSSENEDVFFVKHIVGDGYRLPKRATAYEFCLEVPCRELESVETPFALHAAWLYNDESRVAELLDKAVSVV